MQTLLVQYPTESVELLPVPRSRLRDRFDEQGKLVSRGLREYFVELQSYWAEYVFSVADVAADDRCWELMSKIAFMLPNAKNPALSGFDLDILTNDYEQLETLFLCQGKNVEVEQVHNYSLALFNLDEFAGCKILNLHKFNPRRILEEADELRQQREAERLKVEATAKKPARAKAAA